MSAPRPVHIGPQEVQFPSEALQQLQDSNDLLGQYDALKQQLHNCGYLFLRGFHDRQDVLAARMAILDFIRDSGEGKLDELQPKYSGELNSRCGLGCIPFMEGKNYLTHSEALLKVLESEKCKKFFHNLFGETPMTYDYKWLRGMHPSGFTGAHVDMVYMGRGTGELLTMWSPIGDTTVEMGTLAVCEQSNVLPSFQALHNTYSKLDLEKENVIGTGWFTEDPFEITRLFGGQWKTSDFQAGDVLIFTMKTVHMSTSNITSKVRISCDCRWQPASLTYDPRYVGQQFRTGSAYGVYGKEEETKTDKITMDELKRKWTFS